MSWLTKISQNINKTHLDPWQMTQSEIDSYNEPEFGSDVLYHGTNLPFTRINEIIGQGLLLNKARGKLYNEPEWIWTSLDKEDAYKREQCVVIIKANLKDPYVEKVNQSWVRLSRDVPPQDILYVAKHYSIRAGGVFFQGKLIDFKDKLIWHKLSVVWALKNGFNVSENIINEYGQEKLNSYR